MALTADLKDELSRLEINKNSVRMAELATILRFSGGLHLISGRVAVEVELDTAQLARRVRKDLVELPANITDRLEIVPVSHVDAVLEHALLTMPEPVEWTEADDLASQPSAAGIAGVATGAAAH